MQKLWDISPTVHAGTPVFPGDTPYQQHWCATMAPDCPVNVSAITMSPHVGAHADAPLHYDERGAAIGDVSLDAFLGPCRVVHCLDAAPLLTLPRLQHHWGPYQTAAEGIRPQAVPDQEVQSRVTSPSSKTKIHPFHLFQSQDYLVAELHNVYLTLKMQKDQITDLHKQAAAEIKQNHEDYQFVERDLQIKQQQQQSPNMALDQIEATLDDQHALQQKNDRSDRRTQYALSHQDRKSVV